MWEPRQSITPRDSQFALTGVDIERKVKSLIAEMTLYGAYCLLSGAAIHSVRRLKERSRRHCILLLALLLTFILITVNCAGNIAGALYELHLFVQHTDQPFLDVISLYATSSIGTFSLVANLLVGRIGDAGLVFLITDALAAWRAIIVWPSKILIGLLSFFLTSSFAFYAASFVLYLQENRFSPQRPMQNTGAYAIVSITSSGFSIAANALATFMIGYTAYHQMRLQTRGGCKFSGSSLLLVLTESGVFYVVMQIIRLVLSTIITPSTPAGGVLVSTGEVFQKIGLVLSAMYSPALILIINNQVSLADNILYRHYPSSSQSGERRSARWHPSGGTGTGLGSRTISLNMTFARGAGSGMGRQSDEDWLAWSPGATRTGDEMEVSPVMIEEGEVLKRVGGS